MTIQQFYDMIADNNTDPARIDIEEWLCPKCTFPFYELTTLDPLNINTTNNMALFNPMPEFSISS